MATHTRDMIGDMICMVSRSGRSIASEKDGLKWAGIYDKSTLENVQIIESGGFSAACIGHSLISQTDSELAIGLYHMRSANEEHSSHEQLSKSLAEKQTPNADGIAGKFLSLCYSKQRSSFQICTDFLRSIPLYYAETGDGLVCATDCLLLAKFCGIREVEEHAVYHYLNFSYVPTPYSIFKGIRKLPPASTLLHTEGRTTTNCYWRPDYDESFTGSEQDGVHALRESIVSAIGRCQPEGSGWGTFLSGGNDSSTITGVLASKQSGQAVSSFSIGFDEEGYNELPYAMIAANHFSTQAYTRSVGADETLTCIDKLVDMYDEPFGNSSAIPTYFCSALAADNSVSTLVAGDGGDEVFGGNERYAKDSIFQQFYKLPGVVKSVFQGSASMLSSLDSRFTNRVVNFVHRASLPNPERFYLDDSFASDFFLELLSDPYRSQINQGSSLALLEQHYQDCQAKSDLNRLMFIDLQMAIADNDLMKVNKTARASGVSVLYPFLDRSLIDFSATLPARYKVNGTQKRYLFRKAVEGILPEEVLSKKKQGFGLPVSVWFRNESTFRELIHDVLLSQKAIERGYFNSEFITNLVARHEKGAWDYSAELWMLIILELWFRRNIDE